METRLQQLERDVAGLSERLARLEQQAGAGVPLTLPVPRPPPEASASAVTGVDEVRAHALGAVTLTGRTLLVLGGAFVIRALSEEGVLRQGWGPLLGLLFAAAWVVFAYRAGRAGAKASAVMHGVTASIVGYPLIIESATRLKVMPVALAPVALGALTAALLWSGWSTRVAGIAWSAVVASVISAFGLLRWGDPAVGLHLTVVGISVGAALAADHAGWVAVRWPATVAAHALSLRVVLASARTPEALGVGPEVTLVVLLVAALALWALLDRSLRQRAPVRAFEVVQTCLGWSIAAVALHQTVASTNARWLVAALFFALAAALGYLGLFVLARRATANPRAEVEIAVYATGATLLALAAGALLPSGDLRALAWCGSAAALALLGRSARPKLMWCCGAGLTVSAFAAAGFVGTIAAAATDAGTVRALPPASALAVLLVGLCASFAMVERTTHPQRAAWPQRLPPAIALFAALLTCTALVVQALRAWRWAAADDPGALAALRTAVIGAAAVGVALLARHRLRQRPELAWIAWALLAIGGVKLLVEDVRLGRAVTLLVGFAAFGLALLAVARLLRTAPRAEAAASPADSLGTGPATTPRADPAARSG